MTRFTVFLGAAALALTTGAASAATFDFTGPLFPLGGTNLGTDEVFNDVSNSYSVTATAINTQQPPAPQVNQNGAGLGVNTGTFDINQLDNIFDDEALVFDFGRDAEMSSITLSLASATDDYRIYGTNDGSVVNCTSGGVGCLTGVSSLLASGQGVGIEGTVNVGLSGTYRYLIATTANGFFDVDGYRVAGLDVAPVPLPAAGWLMIAGLGGLAAARRRRAKA
ncbi:MAG: VPLPA-CTERM sorting domain-containing protein [Sedimentitalea sp.]